GAASASSGGAGSATSLAISRPAATAANDVMVAAITAHGSSSVPTITPPAGWTLIVNTTQNGQNLAVSTYWKVAGTAAADPGPYTFTVSSSRVAGGISAYDNVDTTNPINPPGGQVSPSPPSITTTVANTMLVACSGRSSGAPACTHAAGNVGTVCRAAAGGCDVAETCTGTSTACPVDAIKTAGTVCRAAAGECDLAETCDGVTTACPTDVLKASGTTCTDD